MIIGKFFEAIFKQKYSKRWQIVFWLNGALLMYLTLMPSVHHHVSYSNIDKVFHFIGFGAFAFFCVLAFSRLNLIWVVVLSTILGILVEIIQSYMPHRGFSYGDMVADFAGALTAVLFLWVGRKVRARREEQLRDTSC